MPGTGRRGPNDPHRRERIMAAAVEVVAERGIEGLTHRSVAAQAGVPLGSTSYYFATREDLIQAALEDAAGRFAAEMRAWGEGVAADGGGTERFAAELAQFILDGYGKDAERVRVEYEIGLASLRRPALRESATGYYEVSMEVFGRFTDPVRAAALAAAVDGLSLRGLTTARPPERGEVEAVIAAILGGT